MIASGTGGQPIRLEDANDLAAVAEARKLMVRRTLWIDELRESEEAARLNTIF